MSPVIDRRAFDRLGTGDPSIPFEKLQKRPRTDLSTVLRHQKGRTGNLVILE